MFTKLIAQDERTYALCQDGQAACLLDRKGIFFIETALPWRRSRTITTHWDETGTMIDARVTKLGRTRPVEFIDLGNIHPSNIMHMIEQKIEHVSIGLEKGHTFLQWMTKGYFTGIVAASFLVPSIPLAITGTLVLMFMIGVTRGIGYVAEKVPDELSAQIMTEFLRMQNYTKQDIDEFFATYLPDFEPILEYVEHEEE